MLTFLLTLWASGVQASDALVFILAGQSNMEGPAQISDVPASIQKAKRLSPRVRIFCTNREDFRTPRVFFGERKTRHRVRISRRLKFEPLGPCSWNSKTFGPEIGIAETLSNKYPDRDIFLIKRALGGTNLGCEWMAENPPAGFPHYKKELCDQWIEGKTRFKWKSTWLYSQLIASIDRGLTLLERKTIKYKIAGFFWMQGEGDNWVPELGNYYRLNLENFIEHIRDRYGDFPFVLGGISCTTQAKDEGLVNDAQREIVRADPSIYRFPTHDLELQADGCHYIGAATLELGHRFVNALPELI